MSAVARSLVVFGWYLAGFGALLVFVPNLLFGLFGLSGSGARSSFLTLGSPFTHAWRCSGS